MRPQDFIVLFERRVKLSREVLAKKAFEYSRQGNRLHNFDAAAQITGVSPEIALWGMMQKHLVSIVDMLQDYPLKYTRTYLDEKLGDLINYLILLEAILVRDRVVEPEAPAFKTVTCIKVKPKRKYNMKNRKKK